MPGLLLASIGWSDFRGTPSRPRSSSGSSSIPCLIPIPDVGLEEQRQIDMEQSRRQINSIFMGHGPSRQPRPAQEGQSSAFQGRRGLRRLRREGSEPFGSSSEEETERPARRPRPNNSPYPINHEARWAPRSRIPAPVNPTTPRLTRFTKTFPTFPYAPPLTIRGRRDTRHSVLGDELRLFEEERARDNQRMRVDLARREQQLQRVREEEAREERRVQENLERREEQSERSRARADRAREETLGFARAAFDISIERVRRAQATIRREETPVHDRPSRSPLRWGSYGSRPFRPRRYSPSPRNSQYPEHVPTPTPQRLYPWTSTINADHFRVPAHLHEPEFLPDIEAPATIAANEFSLNQIFQDPHSLAARGALLEACLSPSVNVDADADADADDNGDICG